MRRNIAVHIHLLLIALMVSPPFRAAIVLINDASLPGSGDGFNITRDTDTGLEWLDVDVSVGRTFADLSGADGTNEFIAGGDFEGFRFARRTELTGAQNGPQLPSLYRSVGLSPFGFSSIGGYTSARALISIAGCFGACAVAEYVPGFVAAYGYVFGSLVEDDGVTATIASVETFNTSGANWGRSEPNFSPVFPGILPPNPLPVLQGAWLVREYTVVPLPAPLLLLASSLAAVVTITRRQLRFW